MSIDELITFCEEEEDIQRVKAKRADDASGYTRSRDKNIRTSNAIREEAYGDFYKQIASVMRKYQKIEELYDYWRSGKCEYTISCMENIGKVLKNGNDD